MGSGKRGARSAGVRRRLADGWSRVAAARGEKRGVTGGPCVLAGPVRSEGEWEGVGPVATALAG